MTLTNENYFSSEKNLEYMSVSQLKSFMKCEAATMAELHGEWSRSKSTALLVGSYVDAWFEGTLDEFKAENPEIFKRDGTLKADYVQAEEIIKRVQTDEVFMEYMSGEKQTVFTADLFGIKWKIKIDSLLPDKIVDLKVMRSMERIMGKSFVEHWGYDLQMAIYAAVYKKATGKDLPTYLAVVTKQSPSDLELIDIPEWRREEILEDVQKHLPRIIDVKKGIVEPIRCGVCEYCRATKKITVPIDFELVGLSTFERETLFGGLGYDK